MTPERILVVKLADFGDALLATPALRRLRQGLPGARIDALTTAAGAGAFRHAGLVDEVLTFDKAAYDRPAAALRRPLAPLRLGRVLRARRYDAVALLHGLVTRFGAVKHAALVLATGAPVRAGMAVPGRRRGGFLTHAAPDPGYDRAHVVVAQLAIADALLAAAGVRPPPPRPADLRLAFDPGPAAAAEAAALLAPLPDDGRPRVAIHPGAGAFSPARRWTPAGFAAVADGMTARGAHVVLVGRPGDGCADVRARCRLPVHDLAGRTDLPALAAVLAQVDVLVGNDSGVTHLATAMGTPTVAVFGPSNAVAWGPWWPGTDTHGRPAPSPHRVVKLDLPCQPCLYVGHTLGSPAGCPTRDCLAWLPADRVLAATVAVLAMPEATAARAV